jgi:TatD DNase family protein
MRIIDSHCHLDDFYVEGKIDSVLANAAAAQVHRMVAVGTAREDWAFYENFTVGRENIFYTVGLHPIYANQLDDIGELPKFLGGDNRPVAIGEIGLDYHHLPADGRDKAVEMQKRAFVEQLKIAQKFELPVVIHSRQAFDDTWAILLNSGIAANCILFHCYDYGTHEMEQLKEFGAFVSFSGMVTYKKKLAAPLKIADRDRILIETDCPFLTPEIHKPKRNEPAFIRATASCAAEIIAMGESEFCNLTYGNTERFFRMK